MIWDDKTILQVDTGIVEWQTVALACRKDRERSPASN